MPGRGRCECDGGIADIVPAALPPLRYGLKGQGATRLFRSKWSLGDQIRCDDLSANQMLLNDPFQNGRITVTIPSPFGIDNRNRSAGADSQAISLGPIYPVLPG